MSADRSLSKGTDADGWHPVDDDRFRRALSSHASGVVVVTAAPEGGRPVGLTVTSFSSVSLSPPLVSFYVGNTSATWPSLRAAGHFCVSILADDQAMLASRFARRGMDRFTAPTRWHTGVHGVPVLNGALAHLVCRPYATAGIGDHVLVVGQVTEVRDGAASCPLLYQRGRFGRFAPRAQADRD
ncbi:flavin reductase family protein [Streptosporangium sp. NPDC051022]|uniref:flavin reductase family protein n=1 Tax=Streptosporangium sp. NPDC051022 TaxID=3155752 RepID=UPI0034479B5E